MAFSKTHSRSKTKTIIGPKLSCAGKHSVYFVKVTLPI